MMDLQGLVEGRNPWWEDPDVRMARSFRVRRDLQPRLLARLTNLSDRRAVALVGPRQVGKTTLLLQLVDDLLDRGWPPANITYFDFSDARLTEEIVPFSVSEVVPAGIDASRPRVLLFDEISRAVNWDLWLKNVVDRGGFRVAVSDSASSLLRTGTRESGQGRWDEYPLEGWSFSEALRLLGEDVEEPDISDQRVPLVLERYLVIGGFPELLREDDLRAAREKVREDVVGRAIYRDLNRYGVEVDRVKDLYVFLVQESGAIFNATGRAEQLEADPRSVREWVRLLEEAGLLARLPRFAVRPSQRMRAAEKIYAADHGIVSALSLLGPTDPEVRGKIVEAVVYRHLRDLVRGLFGRLSFFRQRDDLEIDFVLEHDHTRLALEVTSSRRLRPDRLERFVRAAERLQTDRRYLVYGGLSRSTERGVEVVPLLDFLLDPAEVLGLEVP